jgi:hypothetical protein
MADVAVDPRTVEGISWRDTGWVMNRDWDEDVDGGYLDFGAATLSVNGHEVVGFRLEVPDGIEREYVVNGRGTVGHFQIANPNRYPQNSFLRGLDVAHHYVLSGVVGDAVKESEGASRHTDAFIQMDPAPGDKDDKHYDGFQVFRSGSVELERVIIDWNDAGTIASTTAAIFVHDEASLTAADVIILNPGGTWQPIRLQSTGSLVLDRVQVVGEQAPNSDQPESLAPTELVLLAATTARFELYNDVPGAENWAVWEP